MSKPIINAIQLRVFNLHGIHAPFLYTARGAYLLGQDDENLSAGQVVALENLLENIFWTQSDWGLFIPFKGYW